MVAQLIEVSRTMFIYKKGHRCCLVMECQSNRLLFDDDSAAEDATRWMSRKVDHVLD